MPNRVHIVIPKELTDEIDSLVSERSRSAFICNAVREKLVRSWQKLCPEAKEIMKDRYEAAQVLLHQFSQGTK